MAPSFFCVIPRDKGYREFMVMTNISCVLSARWQGIPTNCSRTIDRNEQRTYENPCKCLFRMCIIDKQPLQDGRRTYEIPGWSQFRMCIIDK